jgi:hypothetical protein
MKPKRKTRLRAKGEPSFIFTSARLRTPPGTVMRRYGFISAEIPAKDVIHCQTWSRDAFSVEPARRSMAPEGRRSMLIMGDLVDAFMM